jgi:uncharacterized protein (TIGR03435 family)
MMFPAFWNESWTAALVNHLWQSTLVAAAGWLLAFFLRGNPARARYWVWMIASVKFLIPFSLFIAAGEWLRSMVATPIQPPAFAAVMEQITQPFPQAASSAAFASMSAAPLAAAQPGSLLPLIVPPVLIAVWLCGFSMVAFSWVRGWLQARAAVRASSPMRLLTEVPVLCSSRMLEPGIFGIVHPVLLLPAGIGDRLTTAQLGAVVAHEMSHVRRRDNLTAALHTVVGAIFWFHPAVWWIKTRLMEERERACDEAVLQSGNEAGIYAESILNVCRFYVESPLSCMSGVTGSDLKRRIVRIMTEQVAHKLDLSRKVLLGMAAMVALGAPVVFGLMRINHVNAQAGAENPSQNIAGTWQGTLHTGLDLRGVFQISKAEGGGYSGVFYAIDQDPTPFPVTRITLDGANVKIAIADFGAFFDGKLSADGTSVTGTFNQLSFTHPLTLNRATPETAWEIPKQLQPMAAGADPSFTTAIIKPSKPDDPSRGFTIQSGRLAAANIRLIDLISMAYEIHPRRIIGAPAWIDADKLDITAQFNEKGEPNDIQLRSMVRKLLAERFKLSLHGDKKELLVYALNKAGSGAKLTKSAADPNQLPKLVFQDLGKLKVSNGTVQEFANVMQFGVLDRPVVDQTGITGRWDFTLNWTPDDSQFRGMGARIPKPSAAAKAPPNLYAAIEEQIGLKLDATKAITEVMVIDHVEKPSVN